MRDTRQRSARSRLASAAIGVVLVLPAAAGPATAADPELTLQGTLRVVIADDFERGRSETQYALETADGRVELVVPEGTVPDLAGRGIEVTGTRLPDGSVRVEAAEPRPDLDSEAGGGTAGAPAAPDAAGGGSTDAVFGWPGPAVRHVAVVIGAYTDQPAFNGTPEAIAEAMTGAGASVRSFVETASRGRASIDATVLGPWSLPMNSCPADPFGATIDAVIAKASTAGINLAAFDHVIMWTPAPCGTGWTALGEAPGQFIQMSAAYPDASGRLDEFANVAAHELGHNMGLLHANGLACVDDGDEPVALSDWCGATEYGDPFSTMGGDQGWWEPGQPGHFVSPLYDSSELAHLGWLDADEEQLVTDDGSFELVSTYAAAEGVRLLRIRRPIAPIESDPSMGYPLRGGWLTVELRNDPPDGSWDRLVPSSRSTAGVIVRYVEEGYDPYPFGSLPALGSTYLVDTVPETVGLNMWDPEFHDAPLAVGETMTDAVTGTEITLTALDAGGATVDVAFPDGPPPAAPVIAAPTNVVATAGDESATVTWSAPSTNSGANLVTGYTVRSYPGGRLCLSIPGVHTRTCTLTGLANGTTYRFTVTAATGTGDWRMSLPSDPVTPVGPPRAKLQPLALFRSSQAIALAWTASDDGQPVDGTDVRYRSAPWNAGFGSATTWKAGTTDTSGTFTGATGRTYCFSARAINDSVSGPYSSETCTVVPLDDRSLKLGSGWQKVTGSSFFRGTAIRATRQGAAVSKTNVQAHQVALVATRCATCGSVKVYWNGSLKKTISLRSSTTRHKVIIPAFSVSGVKTGTLRLVVGSSGKRVQVDGVAISRK